MSEFVLPRNESIGSFFGGKDETGQYITHLKNKKVWLVQTALSTLLLFEIVWEQTGWENDFFLSSLKRCHRVECH